MKPKTVFLTKEECFILHQSVVQKCDELLSANHKQGLSRKNEQLFYGHGIGQPDPDIEETWRSIKYVMLNYCPQEILKKKTSFSDNGDGIQFNGRYLNDLKNEYNSLEAEGEIEVNSKYFHAYLILLECADKKEMIRKYCESNHCSLPLDHMKELLPTAHSRSSKDPIVRTASSEDGATGQGVYQDRIDQRLEKFKNTHWYYYTYNHKHRKNEPSQISRIIFTIGRKLENGDYEVELLNGKDPFADYSGILERAVSNTSIVIFRLRTKDGEVKHKQLMLHIDPRGKNLYLGQCQEYDDTYTIMSRTVIVQKVEDLKSMKSDNFMIGTDRINAEVDPYIQEYFRPKHLNFLKTKTGISTFFDLKNWLEAKIEERSKANPVNIYDLFVAVPKTEILHDPTYHTELKQKIREMLTDPNWIKMGIRNIYWGTLIHSNQILDTSYVLKREREAFRQSKAFLLIYTEDQPISTSAVMQAGWAIESGKPTFIIFKKRDALPRLLRAAWVLDNVIMPDYELEIGNIPTWFYANEYYKMIT